MQNDKEAMIVRIINNASHVDFFLGAGASVASGVPLASSITWELKKEIYCSEKHYPQQNYCNLASVETQKEIQDYFNQTGKYPPLNDKQEYSFYFEKCFPNSIERQSFIQSIIQNHKPSFGYYCLDSYIIHGKTQNVWTTNFDTILETSLHEMQANFQYGVYGSTNINNGASLPAIDNYFGIMKLHGDYRYDYLKNTAKELQELESKIQEQFTSRLKNRMLVVIGYSGNDDSIMNCFEEHIADPEFLKYGLIWTCINIGNVSARVKALVEKANSINHQSYLVEIKNFDNFMYDCYLGSNLKNKYIEEQKESFNDFHPIDFPESLKECPDLMKTNVFLVCNLPFIYSFESDIFDDSLLQSIIDNTGVIATIFNKKIISLESEQFLEKAFSSHILSKIEKEKIQESIIPQNYITFLFYKEIEYVLKTKYKLKLFGKKLFYNTTVSVILSEDIICYDGISISILLNKNKADMNFSFLPKPFFLKKDNGSLSRERKFYLSMDYWKGKYNPWFSDQIIKWRKILCNNEKQITFSHNDFLVQFDPVPLSNIIDPKLKFLQFDEPKMSFDWGNREYSCINQLKGLSKYGPLDLNRVTNTTVSRSSIRLALLAPLIMKEQIVNHLSLLNKQILQPESDNYLPPYNGFEHVFHRGIVLPDENDSDLCVLYDGEKANAVKTDIFVSGMKRYIDKFILYKSQFDVLIIVLPLKYQGKFLNSSVTSDDQDFCIHDIIKLYATSKGIIVQFLENKSIKDTSSQCKIIWGLSTALYAKASGTLWCPRDYKLNTAYIGISFSISHKNGICVGCSQIFNSAGIGLRLLLRKVNNPIYDTYDTRKRNPYLCEQEAKELVQELLEEYYKCIPIDQLKRIVIYKSTPFKDEEIRGFTQGLSGIEDVELIQVQEKVSLRAIRLKKESQKYSSYSFPVRRGIVVKKNESSFFLWTHGSVMSSELAGDYRNYYQGGKGIPGPLLIKRYHGTESGDILVKDILMLTKMNWNSGDSLYKTLPVPMDFAKTLSRMAKQKETLFNQFYDFRFFM